MAIRVIGAGLGRTGTLSLKTALEELGFGTCHHMIEVFQHPEQMTYWDAASRGERVDWAALFDSPPGYQAVVDYPGCRYYRQLLEYYPEAKVLLTVRSPDSWYESARETIYEASRARGGDATPPPDILPIVRMIQRDIWQGDFGGRFEDQEHAVGVYNRHNAEVKASVPAEKLLVYEVKQGWEPLCDFLGVPVPQGKPFPRVNDRESFQARMRDRASFPPPENPAATP